jgi:hypothetical protein
MPWAQQAQQAPVTSLSCNVLCGAARERAPRAAGGTAADARSEPRGRARDGDACIRVQTREICVAWPPLMFLMFLTVSLQERHAVGHSRHSRPLQRRCPVTFCAVLPESAYLGRRAGRQAVRVPVVPADAGGRACRCPCRRDSTCRPMCVLIIIKSMFPFTPTVPAGAHAGGISTCRPMCVLIVLPITPTVPAGVHALRLRLEVAGYRLATGWLAAKPLPPDTPPRVVPPCLSADAGVMATLEWRAAWAGGDPGDPDPG